MLVPEVSAPMPPVPVPSIVDPLVPTGAVTVLPDVVAPVVEFGLELNQELVSEQPAKPSNASAPAPAIMMRRIVVPLS